jgi:hypothetical protein
MMLLVEMLSALLIMFKDFSELEASDLFLVQLVSWQEDHDSCRDSAFSKAIS